MFLPKKASLKIFFGHYSTNQITVAVVTIRVYGKWCLFRIFVGPWMQTVVLIEAFYFSIWDLHSRSKSERKKLMIGSTDVSRTFIQKKKKSILCFFLEIKICKTMTIYLFILAKKDCTRTLMLIKSFFLLQPPNHRMSHIQRRNWP